MTTREQLRQFLGDDDLASISTWADDIRSARPETGPWHYVDISPDSAGYEPKDCPDDNCVVAQINKFARILGDPQQPFAARSEALKFLVHFVGDLSQPFHAMADARGGNDIPVTALARLSVATIACNLHSVWDSELIQHTGLREHRYVRELEKMIAARSSAGRVLTIRLRGRTTRCNWPGRRGCNRRPNIDEAYYLRERPVVDQQLALAGLRLARRLNKELGALRNRKAALEKETEHIQHFVTDFNVA